MEDREIIELYHRRDERAITETEEKYGPYCMRIARNLLDAREDAEECVSDTWYAAWTRMPPALPQCLRAFLGRITRSLSISRFRAAHAQKRGGGELEVLLSELEDCVPDPQGVEQAVEGRLLTGWIADWLESLGADERALFLRRYWYADGVQALAEQWGCTANQMARRMLRLRRSLKEFLESKGVCL